MPITLAEASVGRAEQSYSRRLLILFAVAHSL